MSKVQWVGDAVDDCKANQSNRDKCAMAASVFATNTGLYGAAQFFRDQCLNYLCTTGTMPSSASDLPAPPPLYEPYPWGVPAPETKVLQGELNKKLKADGLCPLNEDGKLGPGTCGAAKKYGVPLSTCKSFTAPAPCGAPPSKEEPAAPPAAAITTTPSKEVPWGTILLWGGALAVAGVAFLGVFSAKGSAGSAAARANPVRGPSRMAKPDAQGRHPKYKHLVMFEIEPHYGSYILTAAKHPGDALISEDDARHMFGKDYDAGFGYLTDEYLEILKS